MIEMEGKGKGNIKKTNGVRFAIVVAILFIIVISSFIIIYRAQHKEEPIDEDLLADPSWNGEGISPQFQGGYWEFTVSGNHPSSKIIVVKNSTSKSETFEFYIYEDAYIEASVGGKSWWCVEEIIDGPDIFERVEYYIYWWVANYTIVYDDFVWYYYNGTHWFEEQAWHLVYEWVLVLSTPMAKTSWIEAGYVINTPLYNLTLYADWHGFI